MITHDPDALLGLEFDFFGVADNCFKIGDVVLEAVEDANDGYRSIMEELREVSQGDRPFFRTPLARVKIRHTNQAIGCRAYENDDVYQLVDKDDHVWLEFGTTNTNDYYPCFHFCYFPKA